MMSLAARSAAAETAAEMMQRRKTRDEYLTAAQIIGGISAAVCSIDIEALAVPDEIKGGCPDDLRFFGLVNLFIVSASFVIAVLSAACRKSAELYV